MMRRYVPILLLAATGCMGVAKRYRGQICLPDGQPVYYDGRQEATALVSASGLDVFVSEAREDLAVWMGPPPAAVFPLPVSDWDEPSGVVIDVSLETRRDGWTFSPDLVRLRASRREPVGPVTWKVRVPSPGREIGSSAGGAIETKLELRGTQWITLKFPLSSPLEERVELHLEGFEYEGVAVDFPILFVQPAYSIDLLPAT